MFTLCCFTVVILFLLYYANFFFAFVFSDDLLFSYFEAGRFFSRGGTMCKITNVDK